jgi:hypothetical protein
MLAKHALYQLSYGPLSKDGLPYSKGAQRELSSIHLSARGVTRSVVGPGRLELPTSRLSGVCSNQLSYRPLKRSARRSSSIPMDCGAPDARSHRSLKNERLQCYGKRNEDGGDPHLNGVFGEPIGCVSVLEVHP